MYITMSKRVHVQIYMYMYTYGNYACIYFLESLFSRKLNWIRRELIDTVSSRHAR